MCVRVSICIYIYIFSFFYPVFLKQKQLFYIFYFLNTFYINGMGFGFFDISLNSEIDQYKYYVCYIHFKASIMYNYNMTNLVKAFSGLVEV